MIKASKPVTRETAATQFERSKRRPICVTIQPDGVLSFRLKGNRRSYSLDIEVCWAMAVKQAMKDEQKAKRKK